jgi:hypothetical protein
VHERRQVIPSRYPDPKDSAVDSATRFVTSHVTPILDRRTALLRRTRTFVVSVLAAVLVTQSLAAAPAEAATQTISGTASFGTRGTHPAGEVAIVTWLRYETDHWVEGPSEGVRTGIDGDYELALEPGRYKFRYTSTSGAFQSVYWGGASPQYSLQYSLTESGASVVQIGSTPVGRLDLTLPPLGSISGQILLGDIWGQIYLGDASMPAGAGDVRITATGCLDGVCTSVPAVTTDAAGGYTLVNLPHGEYKVHIKYVAGTDYRSYDEPLSTTVGAPQLDVTNLNQILPAAPTVSGTVVLGPDRVPAGADIVVTARRYGETTGEWTDTSVRTAPDGSFLFPGLVAGMYDLKFDYQGAGGFADQWWPGKALPSSMTHFWFRDIPLDYDIRLPVGATVSGTIRNEAGTPIPGATVTASTSNHEERGMVVMGATVSAADGTYSLTGLPPAYYSVEAKADGYLDAWLNAVNDLVEGQMRTGVDGEMRLVTSISGSISCDRCDDPAVGDQLFVQFEQNVGTRAEPAWVSGGGVWATPTDAADGKASYEYTRQNGFEPGVYRASVVGGLGWRTRPDFSPTVTVEAGAEVTLDLDVEFLTFDRDFSGDENPDVLVRTSNGAMLMYTGNGASGWKGASTIGSGWTVMNHVFAAGDFSGDGHEDVMARDTAGRLYLYRGDGKGGWLGWGVVGTGWGHMTAIFSPGDFSGDGNVDVLALDGAGNMWLYPGDGKGDWRWGEESKVGSGWNMFDQVFPAGDFGGYGEANVMGRTPSGDLWVYPASGSEGWMTPFRAGTGWNMFDTVFGAGDFDGDGFDDVMGRDRSGGLWLYPGRGGYEWGSPAVVGTGWGHLFFVS